MIGRILLPRYVGLRYRGPSTSFAQIGLQELNTDVNY